MDKKIKILITGTNGMLGQSLIKFLPRSKFDLSGSYRNSAKLNQSKDNIKKVIFDITDKKSLENLKRSLSSVDLIMHCAAMTDPNECELDKNSAYQTNVLGTKNIVDLAKNFGAKLIYISSPMVFSGKTGDYKEDNRPNPVNYYAKTKYWGEKEALKCPRSLIVRVNPIGVRTSDKLPSFVQWFYGMAKNNKSFDLFSDVRINPLSTKTVVKILSQLALKFRKGILHIGSRDVVNKSAICYLIVSKFSRFSGHINEKSVDRTKIGKIAKRPKEMWLNIDRAISRKLPNPTWREEVELVFKELES